MSRSLESWCGDMCKFQIDLVRRINSRYLVVEAVLKVYSVPPAASTIVQLCSADSHFLWRRPISFFSYGCVRWGRLNSEPEPRGICISKYSYLHASSQ